jgi:hypothetical protein
MTPDVKKELPVATISAIEKDHITLIIELDGKEQTFRFETTPKVEDWVSKNPKQFHTGAVVEYSGKGGIISLIRPAKTFQKASVVNLDIPKEVQARSDAVILPPSPPQGIVKASLDTQPIKPSPTAINVTVTGSFDPAKVHGYEVTDTCQVISYEPITIKVIADDIETARRALVDAWQVFGQHNEIVKETIQKHVERSLLRSV